MSGQNRTTTSPEPDTRNDHDDVGSEMPAKSIQKSTDARRRLEDYWAQKALDAQLRALDDWDDEPVSNTG